jgi:FAD/FMN-containing dehydrogenase
MNVHAKDRSGGDLPLSAIEEFQSTFGGTLILPNSPDYETARRVWNAMIDRRPGMIAMCSTVDHVVQAVTFARKHNLDTAVRGGGHNIAGRAVCDDGIVIDLSRMKAISIAADTGIVDVQAGATLADVDTATAPYEIAIPTGIAPPTGIAGLTLGGGVGWLTRKYGMTCDSLVGCDVVTADGAVLTADKTQNADLFWALRGGGGNFGIVTRFRFQGQPVGTILGGLVLYPREQAREFLQFYREFLKTAPDELTAYVGLIHAPDGAPIVALGACYCGDHEKGKEVLAPLRSFGTVLMDIIQPMPFIEMQKLTYQPPEGPTNNYWRSAFLDELSDAAIDLVIERTKSAGPLSGTFIQYSGGAASRPPAEGTAYPHRRARYNVCIEAQWLDAAENDQHVAWVRGLSDALQPLASPARMLNYLNDEGGDALRQSFGDNYQRLQTVKTQYDPTNFFHHNQNILPLGAR